MTTPAHTVGWLEASVPRAVWQRCLNLASRDDLPYGSLRNMATEMVLDALRLEPWHHGSDWIEGLQGLALQAWRGDCDGAAHGMVRADLRLLGLQDKSGTLVETGQQMAECVARVADAMDVPLELFVAATVLWWTQRIGKPGARRRQRAARSD